MRVSGRERDKNVRTTCWEDAATEGCWDDEKSGQEDVRTRGCLDGKVSGQDFRTGGRQDRRLSEREDVGTEVSPEGSVTREGGIRTRMLGQEGVRKRGYCQDGRLSKRKSVRTTSCQYIRTMTGCMD